MFSYPDILMDSNLNANGYIKLNKTNVNF